MNQSPKDKRVIDELCDQELHYSYDPGSFQEEM